MKALSVTRPWPDLILRHGKNIENRTWPSYLHNGPLLIHAAKSWDDGAIDLARDLGITGLCDDENHHPTGIVGVVDFTAMCSAQRPTPGRRLLPCTCGPWAMPDQYHWRLTNQRVLRPIPCRGMPGLWTPPDEVLAAVASAMGMAVPRG